MKNISVDIWRIYKAAKFCDLPKILSINTQYAFISVWNAHGLANRKLRNQKLAHNSIRHFRRQQLDFRLIWGGSKDMSYRELTAMVKVSNKLQADRLARFAKQNAYYLVNKQNLWLIQTGHIRSQYKLAKLKCHVTHRNKRMLKLANNQAVAE